VAALITVVLIWGVIWGSLSAWLAGQKGRDGTSWFVLGFLFAFIALIVLGFSPSGDVVSGDSKACPQCAERVKAAALVCRFCGYTFHGRPIDQRADGQYLPCWCHLIKGEHDYRDHPPSRQG
jgi:Uncharacterised protein family UPF0547